MRGGGGECRPCMIIKKPTHTVVLKLDLTTFFLYLSKITSNLPENYLSRSKTTCKNKLLK